MTIPIWQRLKAKLIELAGIFAVLAIGIPGVIIAFVDESPTRWWILTLTAVFILISLLFRPIYRVRPVRPTIYTYLVVQTTITIWLLILNPELNFYLIWLYVLAIEAIMLLSQREANIIIALYVILTVGVLFVLLPTIAAFISFPIYLGGFYFFISFAFATNRANQARAESQRLLAELQETHQQLQTYATQVETLAVAEERNRLAREMHDTIGHRLTAAAVQLEAAQKLIRKDAAKAETMVATVREQVREALQELRQTVATLRHPLEADLPLSQALRRLIRDFEQASGVAVNVLLPDDLPELPPAQRLAVYRTVQEGLTNVQKHAQAAHVWLQLGQQNGTLLLRMSDDGVGWPEKRPSTGFGLRGMAERAAQLGGELHLEPRPGGGAQLRLQLPLVTAVTPHAAVQENEDE
jgi:signal transduction histidine kinase